MLGLLSLLHRLSESDGIPLLKEPPAGPKETTVAESRISSAVDFMRSNYFHPNNPCRRSPESSHDPRAHSAEVSARTPARPTPKASARYASAHICRMLLETSDNVSEIAYRVGYQNVHHFHRSFRRLKGCTPKEYREQHTATDSPE